MPLSARFLSGLAAFAAIAKLSSAEKCTHDPINSIQYCHSAESITYSNIGGSGKYMDVVNMDSDACTCEMAPRSFSGKLAPLSEELSMHFRGPLELLQFAVYYPNNAPKKKRTEEPIKRHAHAHKHKRDNRIITETTTITVYVPPAETATGGAPIAAPSAAPSNGDVDDDGDDDDVVVGDYKRTAFYNADAGTAEGLVFLNLQGGQGSGVFDHCFGNSLSYANSTASGGCAEPQILQKMVVPSNNEFIIMTDKPCAGDDCGYYQKGIPAYHGFGGVEKIFLFEFSMPEHKNCPRFNCDMPAIWALNAKIPRTAQYGKRAGGDGQLTCSCWDSGCGEIDLFEVLTDAERFLKTHYHSKQGAIGAYGGGGSPDYFDRPYTKSIQAAVIFTPTGSVTIRILGKRIDFGKALGKDSVNQYKEMVSVYNVPT